MENFKPITRKRGREERRRKRVERGEEERGKRREGRVRVWRAQRRRETIIHR